MHTSHLELVRSTSIIVKSLKQNEPLYASMRGGILHLSELLKQDMPDRLDQDKTEQGIEAIEAIDSLAIGWVDVVGSMDHFGREFKHGFTEEDPARLHYFLSLAHALGSYVTEEVHERDLTGLAYGLGEYTLKCTTAKV